MLIAYLDDNTFEPHIITGDNQHLLQEAIWIDLLSPTEMEEAQVEMALNVGIPTRADMVEIEISSRLHKHNDALFMTALMIAHSETLTPELDPVTFVLTSTQLITIRYIEPLAFKLFTTRLHKRTISQCDPLSYLIELLDASVDRLADILEHASHQLEEYSKNIFRSEETAEKLNYHQLMQQIGLIGDLNTKARESLVAFNRLIAYFAQTADARLTPDGHLRLSSLTRDITSLSDYANFLSGKVNFILDATLGMVNIEQNNIIKIFSVAAVIFLPPTLVASIYGMNFHFMPELSWKYGYLFSIGLIMTAAWLPYRYFKYRKWL